MNKIYSLLLVLLFTLTSCQVDNKSLDIFSYLSNQNEGIQVYYFSSDSIIDITGKKGTKIKIDPKNLYSETNQISDSITVKLTELTQSSGFIRHNVQTVADGKWLISGGSFKIELFSRENPLKLKKGKVISVRFPKLQEEEMQLFYGERKKDGNMNWVIGNQKFDTKKYASFVIKKEIEVDELMNNIYGVTGYFTENYSVDTLGIISKKEYLKIIETLKIDTTIFKADSIIGYTKYFNKESVNENNLKREAYISERKAYNDLYAEIYITKLGWINVDRFYPENENQFLLTITNSSDITISELFVVDSYRNTLISVSKNKNGKYSIELPANIKLEIIAFGINKGNIYGFRKPVKLSKNKSLSIKLKKIKKEKISNFLN